ncbi:MAG: molecular chaperone HtpG [Candidatus Hydrogenedentes bacterium]|nr:molecular chaperone HtpG [Candidatus Hydrogenedentota bacterium]
MSKPIETFEFQTEARQLLDLMIHSVYSNKDIFLRELISNASDALDKRRFEGLKNPALLDEGTELRIWIEPDAEARTLSVADNGIGMTREEVIDLIGTIAKSGTKEFMKKLRESKESAVSAELIGQFGVGFYSTFMVADKVTLLTRKAGEETATRWESTGDGTYTLEEVERDEPGTTVTLHLKSTDEEDGLNDYTQEWQVRQIVKQYSDFVAYPIQMDIERTEIERDADGKPVEGAEEKKVVKTETLNSMKALWLRDKSEVTDEEYSEFYKHISHDWTDPAARIQAKIEGTLEYSLLLYVPAKAPFDLYYHGVRHGVHLYVKRVFIMDDCKELLPEYLRFLRGVVDSEDLSLNISREILQQNRQIERMRKGIVSKVLDFLRKQYKDDKDEFIAFWNEFGRVFKEGIFQDRDNQEAILDLCLFSSTNDPDEYTTLADYIQRMKEGQEAIYYMTGESRAKIESSPHMESFLDKGYEVLILADPVDEIWCQQVFKHKDFELKSISKGAVELGTEEEKKAAEERRKEKEKEYQSLLECLKDKLKDHVKEVRLSNRLKNSPACLVTDGGDLSPQLEQMMRQMGQEFPASKRILELNPDHAVLRKLHDIYDASQDDPRLEDYAQLLHGQALLAEGGDLPNPAQFSKLVADLMVKAG